MFYRGNFINLRIFRDCFMTYINYTGSNLRRMKKEILIYRKL